MRHIKVFLASSTSEFKDERKEFGDFIRALNNIYIEKNIYYELLVCEDISNAVSNERKQVQYNLLIEQSDYFYMLIGDGIGQYTMEEFEVALRHFKVYGRPKIYTYFATNENPLDDSLVIAKLKKKLETEIGHYYSFYNSIDTVKLNLLMEFSKDFSQQYDKQYTLNRLLKMDEGIKQSGKNLSKPMQFAIQSIQEGDIKEAEYVLRGTERKLEITKIVENIELEKRKIEQYISEQVLLIDLLSMSKKDEKSIQETFEIYNKIVDLAIKYNICSDVIYNYARFLCNNNYYTEALTYIKKLWEIKQNDKFSSEYDKGVLCNAMGFIYWKNEQYEEAKKSYNLFLKYIKNVKMSVEMKKEYFIGCGNYALLLSDLNLKQEAVRVYQMIFKNIQSEKLIESDEFYIILLHNYACELMECDRTAEAERLFNKVLYFYTNTDDEKENINILAQIYGNMALLYKKKNEREQALILLQKSMCMTEKLCDDCFYLYAEDLVVKYNNYANSIADLNFEEARIYFEKALHILEILAPNNNRAYDGKVAKELSNYAGALLSHNNVIEAINAYKKSAEIYLNLMNLGEYVYKIRYAEVCTCLGYLFEEIDDALNTKEYYLNAFRTYRSMSQNEIKKCENDYALLCMNMASYMYKIGDDTIAIKAILKKAKDIFKNSEEFSNYSIAINNFLSILDK